MRYTVKYTLGGYLICDSAGRISGRVHRTAFPESSFDVSDGNGSRIWRIGRNREGIFLEQQGEGQFQCGISYPSDAYGAVRQAYTRPPMAERISFSVRLGKMEIRQQRNRIFTVWLDRKKIGEMSHMQSPIKEVLLADRVPPEYCGLCFAAGFLLLHDDDIEIV